MFRILFGLCLSRKRGFLCKCLLSAAFTLAILFWLSNWQSNSVIERRINQKKLVYIHEDIKTEREAIKEENTDEFLTPVLKDYQYVEVNLLSKTKEDHLRDDYDDEIDEALGNIISGKGEEGRIEHVSEFQKDVADAILKKEAFNMLLSDMISPNRSVPDTREEQCKILAYDSNLPTASVIIIYTDEAFSSLIRTIHSVVNRTPAHLLKEIVLVDDFSSRRDLRGKLERYLATKFPKGLIRLFKIQKRAGLIRARMIGAHVAVGDVLVFLDAHCETNQKWMEPLLQRIKEERTAVVCPIIDVIDDKTLEYAHGNGAFFQIGGFTWSGHFTWINIPNQESLRKRHHSSPTRSPTMAGGLFAIDRRYFWEIGSYDSEMTLWGGENLEMSFRIWQCGGSVEIIPCSRVGHIFRNFHPYSFPGNVDSHGLNTARLVEVWMDEYKDIFYSHREELKSADLGDLEKRHRLRKRLKCKDFTWYLDNIYPEKFRLWFGSKYYGQFKNKGSDRCLDNMAHGDSDEYQLNVYPCHPKLFPSQTFYLSHNSELRRENECANIQSGSKNVEMLNCESHIGDKWNFDSQLGRIIHTDTKKCLTVKKPKEEVTIEKCSTDSNQQWIINFFHEKHKMKKHGREHDKIF